MTSDRSRRSARHLLELQFRRPQLLQRGGVGRTAVQRGHHLRQAVDHTGVAREDLHGDPTGLAVRDGVGEQVLVGLEAFVLVGVLDGGGGELVRLVAEQVDLAGPRPFVATERLEARLDLGHRGPRLHERRRIDTAEAIERRTLAGGAQQPLLGVLAVELDQVGAELGESCGGGERAVDVAARPARAWHHPAEHDLDLVAVDDVGEQPFHDRLVGAGTHP